MSRGDNALLAQLREDNDYLELKIKYIQSVGTIFRQKIALLVREVLRGRTDLGPLSDAFDGLIDEMEAAEDPRNKSREQLSKPSLAANGADYWRDQFLSVMQESKPTTLSEAQALCDILQEKNAITVREAALRRDFNALENALRTTKAQLHDVLTKQAISADDAVKELYRMKLSEMEGSFTPEALDRQAKEVKALEEKNQRLEAQNRVLRLRAGELKSRLHELETADRGIDATQQRLEELLTEIASVRATCSAKDAEIRRLKTDLLHTERSIELRELSLQRASSKAQALETEANCALKAAIGDTDTQEITFLQRTVDTFELHVRRLELENLQLTGNVEGLRDVVAEQQIEIATLKAQVDGSRRVIQVLSDAQRASDVDQQQREVYRSAYSETCDRIQGAVDELARIHCIRELSLQLGRLHTDITGLEGKETSIKQLHLAVERQREAIELMRRELNRCLEYQDVPNLPFVELVNALKGPAPKTVIPREVTLRTEGQWSEVRDCVSGNLRYVTLSPKGTPFEPKPPIPPEPPKAKELPAATPSPKAKEQSHVDPVPNSETQLSALPDSAPPSPRGPENPDPASPSSPPTGDGGLLDADTL